MWEQEKSKKLGDMANLINQFVTSKNLSRSRNRRGVQTFNAGKPAKRRQRRQENQAESFALESIEDLDQRVNEYHRKRESVNIEKKQREKIAATLMRDRRSMRHNPRKKKPSNFFGVDLSSFKGMDLTDGNNDNDTIKRDLKDLEPVKKNSKIVNFRGENYDFKGRGLSLLQKSQANRDRFKSYEESEDSSKLEELNRSHQLPINRDCRVRRNVSNLDLSMFKGVDYGEDSGSEDNPELERIERESIKSSRKSFSSRKSQFEQLEATRKSLHQLSGSLAGSKKQVDKTSMKKFSMTDEKKKPKKELKKEVKTEPKMKQKNEKPRMNYKMEKPKMEPKKEPEVNSSKDDPFEINSFKEVSITRPRALNTTLSRHNIEKAMEEIKRQAIEEEKKKKEEIRRKKEEEKKKKIEEMKQEKIRKNIKFNNKRVLNVKAMELDVSSISIQKEELKKLINSKSESESKLDMKDLRGVITDDSSRSSSSSRGKLGKRRGSVSTSKPSEMEADEEEETFSQRQRIYTSQRRSVDVHLAEDLELMKISSMHLQAYGDLNEDEYFYSDSDYSFKSDREDKKRFTNMRKKNTRASMLSPYSAELEKRFLEPALYSFTESTAVYQETLNEINDELEKEKDDFPQLHFEDVEAEQGEYLSENRISKVGGANIYKKIKERIAQIVLLRANSTGEYLAFGLANNNLLLYNRIDNKLQSLITCEAQRVTAIEFFDEQKLMLTGLDSGEIAIYKRYTYPDRRSSYIRVLRIKKLTKRKIYLKTIKVLSNFKAFVACCEDGRLFYAARVSLKEAEIKNYKFKFHLACRGLHNGSIPHLQVKFYKGVDFIVQTLGDRARIFIHEYGLKKDFIKKVADIECPEDTREVPESFPFFDEVPMTTGEPLKVICIHWGFFFCFYPLYNRGNSIRIPLGGVTEMKNQVDFVAQFDNNIYILLDIDGQLLQYNLKAQVADFEEMKIKRGITKYSRGMTIRGNFLSLENQARLTVYQIKSIGDQLPFVSEEFLAKGVLKKKLAFYDEDDEIFGNNEILLELNFRINPFCIIKKSVKSGIKPNSDLMDFANSQAFFMTTEELISFEMMNWAFYLKSGIANNKYLFILKVLNKILEKKVIHLREIPQETEQLRIELKPIIELLMIRIWSHYKEAPEKTKQQVSNLCMMLLIKAGMEMFLQTDLKELMRANNFEDLYFSNLYKMYVNGFITNIHFELILFMLEHYQDEDATKRKILYHCFYFDDKKEFSLEKALSLDHYALSFCFVKNYKFNGSDIPLNYFVYQVLIDPSKKEAFLEDRLYQMFWYINKMAIGEDEKDKAGFHAYPDNDDHKTAIFNWLLDMKNIKTLLELQPIKYLQSLLMLIKKGVPGVLSSKTWNFRSVKPEDIPEHFYVTTEPTSIYFAYLLETIHTLMENTDKYYVFYIFMAALLLMSAEIEMEGLEISKTYKHKTVDYLASNFRLISRMDDFGCTGDDIIILIYKIFNSDVKLYFRDYQFITTIAKKERKLQLLAHMFKGETKSCFHMLQRLALDYSPYMNFLFEWIQRDFQDPLRAQDIIKLLEEEYMYLIREDHNSFSKVLSIMNVEDQMKFIMRYKPPTKSKLDIFNSILSHIAENQFEDLITEEFQLEYINLLNYHDPRKVLDELMTAKYPPSKCLVICEAHNNQLATAYLKGRLGFYEEALEIYKKRLKKVLRALTRGDRYSDKRLAEPYLDRLKKESEMALNLIRETEEPQKKNQEILIFRSKLISKHTIEFMNFLATTEEHYASKGRISEWQTLSSKVLRKILNTVPLEELIEKLKGDSEEFSLINTRHLITKVLVHYQERDNMLNLSKTFRRIDNFDMFTELTMNTRKPKRCETLVEDPENELEKNKSRMLFHDCNHHFDVVPFDFYDPKKLVLCAHCMKEDAFRVQRLTERLLYEDKRKIINPKVYVHNSRSMNLLEGLIEDIQQTAVLRSRRISNLKHFDFQMDKMARLGDYMTAQKKTAGFFQ